MEFKSDRCGIETAFENFRDKYSSVFKSDRCGIETNILHRLVEGVVTSIRAIDPERCLNVRNGASLVMQITLRV